MTLVKTYVSILKNLQWVAFYTKADYWIFNINTIYSILKDIKY